MTVKQLFSDGSKWTSGAVARDKHGEWCPEDDQHAVCWCVIGAIGHCYHDMSNRAAAMLRLTAVIGDRDIARWNDAPLRTFREIRDAVIKARI